MLCSYFGSYSKRPSIVESLNSALYNDSGNGSKAVSFSSGSSHSIEGTQGLTTRNTVASTSSYLSHSEGINRAFNKCCPTNNLVPAAGSYTISPDIATSLIVAFSCSSESKSPNVIAIGLDQFIVVENLIIVRVTEAVPEVKLLLFGLNETDRVYSPGNKIEP